MSYQYQVPKDKMVNIIIDTDAKNEADDQYAIVHALISQKLNVVGIVATHFSKRRTEKSMMESFEECQRVVSFMDDIDVPILKGNVEELTSRDNFEISEGARFIAQKALEYDGKISIACLGALTNVAAAILYEPSIADKIKVIWVGGRTNEENRDGFEANARNDVMAVNIVMEKYNNIIHIPSETYSLVQTSIAELQGRVSPCGKIGKYLFDQLNEFNYVVNRFWTQGESWCLGDTTAIAYLINNNCAKLKKRKAFQINSDFIVEDMENKEILCMTNFDSRYALEDFYWKLYLKYFES